MRIPLKLYESIINNSYFPSVPRRYLISPKWHDGVIRIIPVFTLRDNCIYYVCVRLLEKFILKWRSEWTYGGFSLWWEIRKKENNDFNEVIFSIPSTPSLPFNKLWWVEAWRDFQKKAYIYSKQNEYAFFVMLDIANFYDCINLSILEENIRIASDGDFNEEIWLLFFFLRNWNRKIQWNSVKNVWIPQDEVGGQSRLLANFYLQPYDKKILELCKRHSCNYLRYADDQIFMCQNLEQVNIMIFNASKELAKLWLNINTAKVKILTREEYNIYWSFEIFKLLEYTHKIDRIELAIKKYFVFKEKWIPFREESILSRLLWCQLNWIDISMRNKIISAFLEKNFLSTCDYRKLNQIYLQVKDLNLWKKYIQTLNILALNTPFNSISFSILKTSLKWIKRKKIKASIKSSDF